MNQPLKPDGSQSGSTSIINRIVAFALEQSLLIVLLSLLLVGAGIWALQRLPMDAYPDLSPPMVEVVTQWPGQSAEEVERLITIPVELGLNDVPDLAVKRSISLYGLSDVTLTYRDGAGDDATRQQVFNRLSSITLPDGVVPSVSPLSAPSGLIYRYVLQSSDRSPMELKTWEDWVIAPQYRSIPGVADDSAFGGGDMQYQVMLNPVKLAAFGLTVPQVENSLAANNGNAGGGFYSQGGQFFYVRGLGRLTSLEDIDNVVLAVHNGAPILIKDVGSAQIGIAPRLGEFGYMGQDDAVEGVILLRTGEKSQDVLKGVEEDCTVERWCAPQRHPHPHLLRSERSHLRDHRSSGAQPAGRYVAGDRGADLLPVRRPRRPDRRRHHPSGAAVRVLLPAYEGRLSQPVVHRRSGFRHTGRWRDLHGREHIPRGGCTA
jgi:cobalt-zinc-cadmium resistance protein CzcA